MNSTLKQNATVDDCVETTEVIEIEDKRQKHNEAQRRYRKHKRQKSEANEASLAQLREKNQKLRNKIKQLTKKKIFLLGMCLTILGVPFSILKFARYVCSKPTVPTFKTVRMILNLITLTGCS